MRCEAQVVWADSLVTTAAAPRDAEQRLRGTEMHGEIHYIKQHALLNIDLKTNPKPLITI